MSVGVPSFGFRVVAQHGAARAGVFETPHGPVETPVFMPVGTLGTIKALDPDEVDAGMILANAYHLHLRPGEDVVQRLGGLHRFMGWDRPILTDSGGFQVFSLETLRTVDESGVEFRSHLDGSRRHFTPESVMRIERLLGADIIMQFDHVVAGDASYVDARDAAERSVRWLDRCRTAFETSAPGHAGPSQALFPIVQGGVYAELREASARAIAARGDWVGFGIGGLSVGESKADMYRTVEV